MGWAAFVGGWDGLVGSAQPSQRRLYEFRSAKLATLPFLPHLTPRSQFRKWDFNTLIKIHAVSRFRLRGCEELPKFHRAAYLRSILCPYYKVRILKD